MKINGKISLDYFLKNTEKAMMQATNKDDLTLNIRSIKG